MMMMAIFFFAGSNQQSLGDNIDERAKGNV
jgi:hypothetical protein